MPAPHDVRTLRIEKQLAASLQMLRRATSEAESLDTLDLSNDLHDLVLQHTAILDQLVARGRRYQHPLTTVRN